MKSFALTIVTTHHFPAANMKEAKKMVKDGTVYKQIGIPSSQEKTLTCEDTGEEITI